MKEDEREELDILLSQKVSFFRRMARRIDDSRLMVTLYCSLKYFIKNLSILSPYALWIRRNEPNKEELSKQRCHKFILSPKITLVTHIFDDGEEYLVEMINSVRSQTYANWELCIVEGTTASLSTKELLKDLARKDSRIKLRSLRQNKGASVNADERTGLPTGDFIALLGQKDVIPPFALFEVVNAINKNPAADFIYSDEDNINEDGRKRSNPFFKPDFSPYTLRSFNYISHLSVFKRSLGESVGWPKEGCDCPQDYDLILRLSEKAKEIFHIPKILYHSRILKDQLSGKPCPRPDALDQDKKSLSEHLQRMGVRGRVEDSSLAGCYRVVYEIENKPLVSIIIPNQDHAEYLAKCIKSILKKSSYRNFEIIVIENRSSQQATFKLYDKLNKLESIRIVNWDKPFNFSAINNFGVKNSAGEIILFLNNDTEIITPGWLEGMLEFATREDVGAVGAKLYYPNGTLQHAGVIIGMGGLADHCFRNFPRESIGYSARLRIAHNLSAVTGACFMMRKKVFEEAGGLDERLEVAFNDVDLCLKIRERGYYIVWTPYVELYHHESRTRGFDDTPEKRSRLKREIDIFLGKWKGVIGEGDPYYNPNLDLNRVDFALKNESRWMRKFKLLLAAAFQDQGSAA